MKRVDIRRMLRDSWTNKVSNSELKILRRTHIPRELLNAVKSRITLSFFFTLLTSSRLGIHIHCIYSKVLIFDLYNVFILDLKGRIYNRRGVGKKQTNRCLCTRYLYAVLGSYPMGASAFIYLFRRQVSFMGGVSINARIRY